MIREPLDYFVLDTLANDLESLEDVLRLLNSPEMGWRHAHPEPFTREEVIPALIRRILAGDVEACPLSEFEPVLETLGPGVLPPDARWGQTWFKLTGQGRIAHMNWDAPMPDGDDATI
jgi:hypothetical protein